MTLFVIVRDDVALAEGVMFVSGTIVVHALLRGSSERLSSFGCLADVKQYYANCDIELVSAGRAAYLK